MTEQLSLAAAAALGILGYALMSRASAKSLGATLVVGLAGTSIYILCDRLGLSSFLSNMFATIVLSLGSELCARIFKIPTPVFLFPAIIVLVPGSCLYYSMSSLLSADYPAALENGIEMLRISGGIVDGLLTGLVITSTFNALLRLLHRKKKAKKPKKAK